MPKFIDTDHVSADLRARMIDVDSRAISLTRFLESEQQSDLSEVPNCDGYGRVHTFQEEAFDDWPTNPLPIRPANRALGIGDRSSIAAQVFQNSGCNWRCWYCFVPFADLTARRGHLVPITQMVSWTLDAHSGPHMVDLTGGQPDLTPEWSVWFLEELDRRSADRVYVWSDDNLSTSHLWTCLNEEQRGYLGTHPRYGRACCIKGYDEQSFSFNTMASPELFDRQLYLLRKLREQTSIDYYVYLTITTPTTIDLQERMRKFADRLQSIHEFLPLRCIPLKILEWGPVGPRMNPERQKALRNQAYALDAWQEEITSRFPGRTPAVEDVPR